MIKKQFTVHTKEENWETEDGVFTRYRHFLYNDGNIVIELNSHINNCWDFADMLNNLYEENNGDEIINDCKNCMHFNELIHWEEGLFQQCMMGNKMWEKCNDYEYYKS